MRLYVLSLVVAAVVATATEWLFLNDQDRYGAEGIGLSIALWDLGANGTSADLKRDLTDIASDAGVNIYLPRPMNGDGLNNTAYFVFIGDESSLLGDPATGSFPTFGHMYFGELRPGVTLAEEQAAGSIFVQGSVSDAERIINTLTAMGARVDSPRAPASFHLLAATYPMRNALGPALITGWLGLLVATLNVLNRRLHADAIRKANGERPTSIGFDASTTLLVPALIACAIPLAFTLGYSFLSADGYRADQAAMLLPIQVAYFLSAPIVALAIRVSFWDTLGVGRLLTGGAPDGAVLAACVTALVFASTLTAVTASGFEADTSSFTKSRALDEYWAQNATLATPVLGYAGAASQSPVQQAALASVFKGEEREGTAFLSASREFRGKTGSTVIVANSNFLASLSKFYPDVGALTDALESVQVDAIPVILVPQNLAEDLTTVEAEIRTSPIFRSGPSGDGDLGPVDFRGIRYTAELLVPLLDTVLLQQEPAFAEDPIIVVADAAHDVLNDVVYIGSGAYTNQQTAREALERIGALEWTPRFYDLQHAAELKASNDLADLFTAGASVAVSILVFLLAWVLISAIYLSRQRVRLFIQWTTGASFGAKHGPLLVGCLACTAFTATVGFSFAQAEPWIMALGVTALVAITATAVLAVLFTKGRAQNREALFDS